MTLNVMMMVMMMMNSDEAAASTAEVSPENKQSIEWMMIM